MPACRGSSQRQTHRDARAIQRRRVRPRDKDVWHQAFGRAARGLSDAARRRCGQGGSGVAGFPDQRIRPAGSRNSRRVREALRDSGPVGLWGNGIRGLAVRMDTGPRRGIRRYQARQRRQAAARYPGARRRRGHRSRGARRASRGCWRPRWRRSAPTGSAPPTSPRSTPTGSSPCTAGRTARSTAADSRSCPKPFGGC